MIKIHTLLVITALFTTMGVFAGESVTVDGESFAQEYANLGTLLGKVQSKNSAVKYKPQIAIELEKLRQSQPSGEDQFSSLSENEKKIFIKKFQNNQFHCGEVTKVMEERNRLLLNSETREVLGSLLNSIP